MHASIFPTALEVCSGHHRPGGVPATCPQVPVAHSHQHTGKLPSLYDSILYMQQPPQIWKRYVSLSSTATTDIEEIRLLVLKFLPLTATDAACRAAILNHEGGLPMLLRAAGRRHAAAICALRRVAADYKLKTKCATVMAEVRPSACMSQTRDQAQEGGSGPQVDFTVQAQEGNSGPRVGFTNQMCNRGGLRPSACAP
eukprot:1148208-Pelagomonas_calceolata.AAC.5